MNGNNLNIRSVLDESRLLASRMRVRDETFDGFLKRGKAIKNFIAEKKKVQEGLVNLRQLADTIPANRSLGAYVLCLAAENEQLEKLREENSTLKKELEAYKLVMDLIMSKYRSQISKSLYLMKPEDCNNVSHLGDNSELHAFESSNSLVGLPRKELIMHIKKLTNRVNDLSNLSLESLEYANQMSSQNESRIQELEIENANLRELMKINVSFMVNGEPNESNSISTNNASNDQKFFQSSNVNQLLNGSVSTSVCKSKHTRSQKIQYKVGPFSIGKSEFNDEDDNTNMFKNMDNYDSPDLKNFNDAGVYRLNEKDD